MSPYEIELLLHFHTRPDPLATFSDSPLLGETLSRFCHAGLLNQRDGHYTEGPALACWVEAVCAIPAPVQTWSIPK